jgi:hypothetical protein
MKPILEYCKEQIKKTPIALLEKYNFAQEEDKYKLKYHYIFPIFSI